MSFWRSPAGIIAGVLLWCGALVLGGSIWRVADTTAPPRRTPVPLDFEAMMLPVEDVEFPAADGVRLRGWYFAGDPGLPSIVLAHDHGASKASLLNLAIELREAGFPQLLFDFRGHGASDASGSTLGLAEKRDVLGAIDFLTGRLRGGPAEIGLYGVGMGAHAAVLAAADRPGVTALVLDGLYPDVAYALAREFYGDWSFGVHRLSVLPRTAFALLHRGSSRSERAADVIPRLLGRDLLLLAPEQDAELSGEMRAMYESIPEQVDVDGNLRILPATQRDGLGGEEFGAYNREVTRFFRSRLAAGGATLAGDARIRSR